ncbi:MAG: hypothetical protein ABIF77_07440 [bacterium]
MSRPAGNGFSLKTLGSWPALLAMVVAAGLLIMVILPRKGAESGAADPVAEAEAAYISLVAQMGSVPTEAVPEPVVPGSTDMASAGVAGGFDFMLNRDLFSATAPEPTPRRQQQTAAAKPQPPRPPRCTTILIDGDVRQAVLGGQLVTSGDVVSGFVVVEITSSSVRLVRGDTSYTLKVGGNR